MTMLALAPLAGVSRRTLYNHFANKEDAFRFIMRCDGDIAIEQSLKVAYDKLEAGAKPLDIFVALMDTGYAEVRPKAARYLRGADGYPLRRCPPPACCVQARARDQ